MTDRQELAVAAEQDLLVRDEAWETNRVDRRIPAERLGRGSGSPGRRILLRLVVEPTDAFERWVASQRGPALQPPAGLAADGAAVFAASACVGCHTVRGVSSGVVGPDLTHFGRRATVGAGLLPNTVDNVTGWILDPPRIKPGVKMPALGLTEAQARSIAVYLLSLK